jgi:hypothetical protein
MLLCLLPAPAAADWSCDGDPLRVETVAGSVDPTGLPGGIPNTSAGTLPGDGVLIHWREMTLQLPRTNNAGVPSYTDGRWWWRVEDPLQPEFLQRRGSIVSYDCQPLP